MSSFEQSRCDTEMCLWLARLLQTQGPARFGDKGCFHERAIQHRGFGETMRELPVSPGPSVGQVFSTGARFASRRNAYKVAFSSEISRHVDNNVPSMSGDP
jgi:hypothetical protein